MIEEFIEGIEQQSDNSDSNVDKMRLLFLKIRLIYLGNEQEYMTYLMFELSKLSGSNVPSDIKIIKLIFEKEFALKF